MGNIIQLSTVTGEEDGAGAGTISNADNISLEEFRAVWGRVERLVVTSMAGGCVGD